MSDSSPNSQDKTGDRHDAATRDDMDELRDLIIGPTDQRLARMQDQLNDPERRAGAISRVLHKAIALSATRDDKLATALQPITEDAIRSSIKKDRQVFVDVLFPVMGPAIRKAIAATIQRLIQNFNQILEHSFSIRGFRWRLEAWRTRRPFAEVVLLHTLVYQVEQVFLIHRASGLLIDHIVAKISATRNPDLVSGMLTAIQDFVQDSFGSDQEDTLDTFQVGDRKVWIEYGAHAMLALVISGNPSLHLKDMMRDALDEIHVTQSEKLLSFSGDVAEFEEIRPTLNGLLQVQFKSDEDKKALGSRILMVVVAALLTWGAVHWAVQRSRWSQFIEKLHDQPGIVLTEVKKVDGKQHLYGLRDPFAPPSAQLLKDTRISSKSVVFHWEPYQSAHPEYAQQRFKKLFKPPASVNLVFESGTLRATGSALRQWKEDTRRMARIVPWIDQYDDYDVVDIDTHLKKPETVTLALEGQTLYASGSAPGQWISQARVAVKSITGISKYDDSQLMDTDAQEWDALTRAINDAVFYFKTGRNVLMPGQQSILQDFIKSVKRLMALSDLLNRPTRIEIVGHADRTGNEANNRVISRSRAQTFADLLSAARIDRTFFSVRAAGSRELVQPEINDRNRAFNRRVVFFVQSNTR